MALDPQEEKRIRNLEVEVGALTRQVRDITDSQTIHGILQWRTERNLAELSDKVSVISDKVNVLADGQLAIQAALQSLMAQIDRFLCGQQRDGHE